MVLLVAAYSHHALSKKQKEKRRSSTKAHRFAGILLLCLLFVVVHWSGTNLISFPIRWMFLLMMLLLDTIVGRVGVLDVCLIYICWRCFVDNQKSEKSELEREKQEKETELEALTDRYYELQHLFKREKFLNRESNSQQQQQQQLREEESGEFTLGLSCSLSWLQLNDWLIRRLLLLLLPTSFFLLPFIIAIIIFIFLLCSVEELRGHHQVRINALSVSRSHKAFFANNQSIALAALSRPRRSHKEVSIHRLSCFHMRRWSHPLILLTTFESKWKFKVKRR